MKLKEKKCIAAVRDFILERVRDKEARHELIDLAVRELWYLDEHNCEFIMFMLERSYGFLLEDCGGKAPVEESEEYISGFKKCVYGNIDNYQFRHEDLPFFPYPENELWKINNASRDGVASLKMSDGSCRVMRCDSECGPVLWDEKINDFFIQLFGDEETAEMFLSGRVHEVDYGQLTGIMREKLEFWKEKTTEELDGMSDAEVVDFFEKTFGENYFKYFDDEGHELTRASLNDQEKFHLIFKPADGRIVLHIDETDEDENDEESEGFEEESNEDER